MSGAVIIAIAVLAVFLVFSTGLKYAIPDNFRRTRLIMSAFFLFIVATLTISFWQYALASLTFAVPAALAGMLLGYVIGVRTDREKIMRRGIGWYREHFAHVHLTDLRSLNWWSVLNFYTVMAALLMINLVGLSNVIFAGREGLALATCAVGAFLLGSIVPYLLHLWGIKAGRRP